MAQSLTYLLDTNVWLERLLEGVMNLLRSGLLMRQTEDGQVCIAPERLPDRPTADTQIAREISEIVLAVSSLPVAI